ncbi:hypothetical protein Q3G72_012165 [Acer saccharum]|nr:hypothetical protein Q3G72_012165 [Acer saccharum]
MLNFPSAVTSVGMGNDERESDTSEEVIPTAHCVKGKGKVKAPKSRKRPLPNVIWYGSINLEKRKVLSDGNDSTDESWTLSDQGFEMDKVALKGQKDKSEPNIVNDLPSSQTDRSEEGEIRNS